tara:strand:- start:1132 stop:1839 length:708 start_codon:yes stop_codon:yes gene_type:complete
MLDFFFAMMAATINGAGSDDAAAVVADAPPAAVAPAEQSTAEIAQAAPAPATGQSSVSIGQGSVIVGQGTLLEGVPATTAPAAAAVTATAPAVTAQAQDGFNMAVVPAGLVAEPQTPSGKFTTATEVKPILNATKGSWVAVREYDGKDLLYVTHLWSWRCGLSAVAISLNGEPMQNWPLPPCHMDFAAPNAILEDDGLPYLSLRLGSVETITIQVVYDDLSMDVATFNRSDVRIP